VYFRKNKPENPFQNYDLAKKLLEAQKKYENRIPDRKPDPRPGKIYVQINQYVKRNLPKIFRYDHQKYKNRKPDRKPDPGPTGYFYG